MTVQAPPAPGEVHVWSDSLERLADETRSLWSVLSAAERERAARYRFDEHREAFALRRGVLRMLLERYVGMPAAAIELDERCEHCGGAHGRPRLTGGPALRFSCSRSADRVVCAFASGGAPVGIDVERIDLVRDWEGPAALALAEEERAACAGLPATADRARWFYVVWTRKEALAKATGLGLVLPLAETVVTPPGEPPRLLRVPAAGSAEQWTLTDLDLGDGYAAALAVRAPAVAVRHFGPTGAAHEEAGTSSRSSGTRNASVSRQNSRQAAESSANRTSSPCHIERVTVRS